MKKFSLELAFIPWMLILLASVTLIKGEPKWDDYQKRVFNFCSLSIFSFVASTSFSSLKCHSPKHYSNSELWVLLILWIVCALFLWAPSFLGIYVHVSTIVSPQLAFSLQFSVVRFGFLKNSLNKVILISNVPSNPTQNQTAPPAIELN